MLIRVAPRLFQTNTGETVTIAAVARDNNGFEGATFQYAGVILQGLQVQNHPACQFIVAHGVDTFAAMLLFDLGSPNAVYDLFEVDAAGNFLALVDAPASAGRFTQFQIDGRPVASFAAAARAAAAVAARPVLSQAALAAPVQAPVASGQARKKKKAKASRRRSKQTNRGPR
jgi:hypothetical protein